MSRHQVWGVCWPVMGLLFSTFVRGLQCSPLFLSGIISTAIALGILLLVHLWHQHQLLKYLWPQNLTNLAILDNIPILASRFRFSCS
jgi:hypothetical protein